MIYKLTTSLMYSVLLRYKCLHCYNYTICQVRAMPVPVPDILLALESLNLMNFTQPQITYSPAYYTTNSWVP